MAQNITLLGASYSNVPAVTLPKTGGGTARFDDTSDATATAADILSGKTAYVNGTKVVGTATGGTGGITQDAQGYLVLDDEGEGGDSPTPPTPTPWTRPSGWPDLSQMDVSAGDILYMTSYADEARGFCSFSVTCTGSYTVEVGTISGTTYTAESSQTFASNTDCELYYGSANGTYKVLRVTGTAITKLAFKNTSALTIGNFDGYASNQGIIDIVGKLPSGTGLSCREQRNLVNVEIDGLALSGYCNDMFNGCCSLTSLDVSGWDTSSVTNMNSMFYNCRSLVSLDVSEWDFTGVTSTSGTGSMFRYNYGLHGSLTIPSSLSYISTYCFATCRSLKEWHFLSTTPPTLGGTNAFDYMSDFGGKKIYVPAASLSAYQTATNWSTYASYMVGE